jgi:hypothetical protein
LEHLEGFLTGVHFHPMDFAFAAVGLFYCGIEHPHRGAPDIPPRAISFDKGDDRIVGNVQFIIFDGNPGPTLGDLDIGISHV